jgi:hypothetical protein
LEELAKRYPLQALFSPTLMGKEGTGAKVDDTRGDADGPMVWETIKRAQYSAVWLSWSLDHLISNGLTPRGVVDFVSQSPVFSDDRIPLIERGVNAHFLGDYVQSIHLLVPQIERAVVGLTYLLGGTSVKPHRSGRAMLQAKSLNDALDDESTRDALGPDLTMYLIATLSHPKGMNIRNEVCHGLWPPHAFNKTVSERLIHVLLAISLLRAAPSEPDGGESDESK